MVRHKTRLSVTEAEEVVNRFTPADRYHIEEVGEGYIITFRDEKAGEQVMAYFQRTGVESGSFPLAQLLSVSSTGNEELDRALKDSITQVFGAPG